MNSRERLLAALHHEERDRVPITDYLWTATVERWHTEGIPPDVTPAQYFGFENVAFDSDTSPRFQVEVLDETEEYVILRDFYGGRRRNHKDYSTTPEVIDYPVKNRGDWEKIKERLKPGPDRVDWDGNWPARPYDDGNVFLSLRCTTANGGLAGCRKAREEGKYVQFEAYVGFDKIQWYVASQQLLVAMIDDPEWVRDMFETDADLAIQQYEIMVAGGFRFDGAHLVNDLGYRNGLLFSPRLYDALLRPTIHRLISYFNGQGLPVTMHSCGSVVKLIPRFIEDGLAGLDPLETKAANMDLVELKKEFGDRLTLIGGIDVRAMADPDPSVIEEEIKRKLTFVKRGGGYIYASDHSVPNNVSLKQYERVIELVHKYGGY
jgi:uroporphyrinogen decarboxylase